MGTDSQHTAIGDAPITGGMRLNMGTDSQHTSMGDAPITGGMRLNMGTDSQQTSVGDAPKHVPIVPPWTNMGDAQTSRD